MKKISFVYALIIFIFLSGCKTCGGYNETIIKHLSDLTNYTEYECEFLDVGPERVSGHKGRYLYVVFNTDLGNLTDVAINDKKYDKKYTPVELVEKNEAAIKEKNFFSEIQKGDKITMLVSSLIYMDTNYFYVISITVNDKIYLEKETGIANVVEMMNQNKSLL